MDGVRWPGLLCCLIGLTWRIAAQCGDPAMEALYRAEIAFRHQDWSSALPLYQVSLEGQALGVSDVLYAMECSLLAKDSSAAIQFLAAGLTLGLQAKDYRRFWPRIGRETDLEMFLKDIPVDSLRRRYLQRLDQPLVRQLRRLARRDQRYRGEDQSRQFYRQNALDDRNGRALMRLVSQNGRLPHYTEIGMQGSEDLETLFYHMDLEWLTRFMPFARALPPRERAAMGKIILYQLDRIGMAQGVLYSISTSGEILAVGARTRMENGFWCQSFGEWFDEKSRLDGKLYATPVDPGISLDESDRVRALFCLDNLASFRQRRPWSQVVSLAEFSRLIDY